MNNAFDQFDTPNEFDRFDAGSSEDGGFLSQAWAGLKTGRRFNTGTDVWCRCAWCRSCRCK